MIESSDGVRSCHLNSTFSNSISIPQNVYVSVSSPFGSPRVFHLVIRFAALCAIANCKNSVVKFCAARTWKDSFLVKLESQLSSLNCNRNRILSDSCHQSFFTVDFNLSAVTNLPSFVLAFIIFACHTNTFVWESILSSNSVIFDVEKCLIHESSITALIFVRARAVDELLLGEAQKFTLFDEMNSFHWSCCWKSPAWTALALIFNGSYSSFLWPINFVWKIQNRGLRASAFRGHLGGISNQILSRKLILSHVRKGVHLNFVAFLTELMLFVVRFNEFEVFKPDTQSISLFVGRVAFAVLSFPDFKAFIVGILSVSQGIESDGAHCEQSQQGDLCFHQ